MIRRSLPTLAAVAVAVALIAAATVTAAPVKEPTLEGRALLAPDASAPAPFAGEPNTEPDAQPGARQPVGGFSALIDARGKDTFWAMPDNGFGSKANSQSFLLRVYRVRADFETARGGSGEVEILDWITLRDPDGRVPFPIVTEGTDERLLTGGDLDLESMRVARDGTLWFGEEFGPFLVHTDATGRVLEAPIPLPGVQSPDSPLLEGEANLARSNGFEGMAISKNRKTLYPVLEGPVAGDDPTRRRVYAFDIATRRYVERLPDYRVADPGFLVSDFTALDGRRFIALERDNSEGQDAVHKQGFVVDLRDTAPDGTLDKRRVVDLLDLRDPALISEPGRPGGIGLGDPFAMPYVTIEAVLPLGGQRLAIVNDTNFGSTGRNPELPDPSDFIVVGSPGCAADEEADDA
ncbi:MAG: esterase-like activity of phytase family protein, partial [Solirubrobacterales bacterium]|nr:esterase-like activity of phytase family protein [Solirubrobacterales bacterium]